MGIAVEFNPNLALRKFGSEGRNSKECLPVVLMTGECYDFLKKGEVWTKGLFLVQDVFDNEDAKINFESYRRVE